MSVDNQNKIKQLGLLVVGIATNLIISRILTSSVTTFMIIFFSLIIQTYLLTSLPVKTNTSEPKFRRYLLIIFSLIIMLPAGIMGIFTPLKMNIPVSGVMFTWLTINRRILLVIGLIAYLIVLFVVSMWLKSTFHTSEVVSSVKKWWFLIVRLLELVLGTFAIIFVMAGVARIFNDSLGLKLIDASLVILVNYYQLSISLKIFGIDNQWRIGVKLWQFIFVVVCLLGMVAGIQLKLNPLVTPRNNAEIIVHRGVINNNGLYNRISSLKKNGDKGYPYIEMDIQETKDHQFICQHDDYIKINGKSKLVNQLTLGEIQKYHSVDLFKDYLRIAGTLHQRLVVELKVTNVSNKNMGKTFIRQFGHQMASQHNMVHSIGYRYLMQIKAREPKVKVGLVTMLNGLGVANLKPDFYTLQDVTLNDYLVAQCQTNDRKVYSWTDNAIYAMKTAKLLGVQGQVTDRADRLKRVSINPRRDAWLLILNQVWDYA
ncbi:glycerophosphodiester phosphodiesterase family protein [Lentilactobacillus kosonis]|uniref:Glycerophosphoryl diester phosphodiesterase n=1 Tax=Lentilactobacillus kosonis TaxID=2810561 RepID=A0A401FNJ5_9LACO|nr:glycerophosphodiester phosphodiesterase family protein [Lentilactobacillus kosonis]GAY73791.1 glycerophosphoryl diester phosphodiesterase [Lentilactobacillus kosonis]